MVANGEGDRSVGADANYVNRYADGVMALLAPP